MFNVLYGLRKCRDNFVGDEECRIAKKVTNHCYMRRSNDLRIWIYSYPLSTSRLKISGHSSPTVDYGLGGVVKINDSLP